MVKTQPFNLRNTRSGETKMSTQYHPEKRLEESQIRNFGDPRCQKAYGTSLFVKVKIPKTKMDWGAETKGSIFLDFLRTKFQVSSLKPDAAHVFVFKP